MPTKRKPPHFSKVPNNERIVNALTVLVPLLMLLTTLQSASALVSTTTTVTCPPFTVIGPGAPCLAVVSGSSPTGTVTFSLVSGSGSFTPSNGQCTLSGSKCNVIFTGSSTGGASISASYGGDGSNSGSSSSSASITIKAAPTFINMTCTSLDVTSTSTSNSCKATVQSFSSSAAPSGSVTFSASPSILTYSTSNPCTLSASGTPTHYSCSVSFTGSSSGLTTLTAAYTGDSNFAASSNFVILGEGLSTSTVSITGCTTPSAGASGTCTVTVTGSSPTGSVIFPPGTGSMGTPPLFYVPPGCTLSSGSCTMTFIDPIASDSGSIVKAVYTGDSNNGPGLGTATITTGAALSASGLSVSCSPTEVTMGSATTCTVSFSSGGSGAYVFVSGSLGASSFGASSPVMPKIEFCQVTVAAGSCTVKFTGIMPGQTNVGAFFPASPMPLFATTSTPVTVDPGTGSNTQRSGMGDLTFQGNKLMFTSGMPTDASVSFTPASGDAGKEFTSTFRVLNSVDSGVSTLGLGNLQYGDASVGATSGATLSSSITANVCLPNTGADPNTILQYWTGSSWASAANIVVTGGVKVCGDIPISSLTGTNIGGGDPPLVHGERTPGEPPSFTTGFAQNESPLTINSNNYKLPNYTNTGPTSTITLGAPFKISVMLYGDIGPSSVEHVSLFTNIRGNYASITNADTALIWDAGAPLHVVDPHHFFGPITTNATVVGNKIQVTFSGTFVKPMPVSDIGIRMWGYDLFSQDIYVINALQSTASVETTKSTLGTTQASQTVNPTPSIINPSTATNNPSTSENDLVTTVKEWAGYSPTAISDQQMLQSMGYSGTHVPTWVMKNMAKYLVDGSITQDEFAGTIKYLVDNHIVK